MLYLRFISSFKMLENSKCLLLYTEKELYFTGRNCFYIFLEISSEIQTIHDELYLNLTKWLKDDFRSRVYTANTPREKIEETFSLTEKWNRMRQCTWDSTLNLKFMHIWSFSFFNVLNLHFSDGNKIWDILLRFI